jgi:hypothetical protein
MFGASTERECCAGSEHPYATSISSSFACANYPASCTAEESIGKIHSSIRNTEMFDEHRSMAGELLKDMCE